MKIQKLSVFFYLLHGIVGESDDETQQQYGTKHRKGAQDLEAKRPLLYSHRDRLYVLKYFIFAFKTLTVKKQTLLF